MCCYEYGIFIVNYTHKRPLCGHCASPLQKPSQSVCAPWGLTSWGFIVMFAKVLYVNHTRLLTEIYVDRKDFFIIIAKNVLMENPLDESGGFPYT